MEQALLDRLRGVVKFIQVFHVHIFNAEFMQSADAQMRFSPCGQIPYPAGDSWCKVSRRKPPDRTRCRFPAGGQRQKNPRHFYRWRNTVLQQ